MTMEQMKKELRESLNTHRYAHTLGVAETALALALQHGADADKAYLAGLLHDCAKRFDGAELLCCAQNNDMIIDDVERAMPELLHARVGRVLAQDTFGVRDEAVLNAIERHIHGCPEMTMLDMLVNIADYTEPGRDFPDVEWLRGLAMENPVKTMIECFRGSMMHILGKGGLLHPEMVITYNALLLKNSI